MEERENKELDAFVKRIMSSTELDSPSNDFLSHVMDNLPNKREKELIQYKPLISKPVWFVIGGLFLAFMGYLVSKTTMVNSSWFSQIDFDQFFNLPAISFSTNWPQVVMYALLVLGLMLLVQVSWMKHFYNKRLGF